MAGEKPITEQELEQMIAEFESLGFMSFVVGEDQARFDALFRYTRENHVPLQTEINEEEGTVTLRILPHGSPEGMS
jgi:hypothetical protein